MSDVHYMVNDWAMPPMSTFGTQCAGHEGAGVIVKVGANVTSPKVGQRAGLKPAFEVCHVCEQCRSGRENYCPGLLQTGLQADGGSTLRPCLSGLLSPFPPSAVLTVGVLRG